MPENNEENFSWPMLDIPTSNPTILISELKIRRFGSPWRWWISRNWKSIDLED